MRVWRGDRPLTPSIFKAAIGRWVFYGEDNRVSGITLYRLNRQFSPETEFLVLGISSPSALVLNSPQFSVTSFCWRGDRSGGLPR